MQNSLGPIARSFCLVSILITIVGVHQPSQAQPIDDKGKRSEPAKDPSPEQAMQAYTTNLTEKVKADVAAGTHPVVVGAEDVVRRIVERQRKAGSTSQALTGNPGVGKTTLVREASLEVTDKIFRELDLTAFIAGASYQGEFDARIKALLKYFKDHPKEVLVIDEGHTFVKNEKLANAFKPPMTNGEISIILMTTDDEYREYIEKDEAFRQRVPRTEVPDPTDEQVVAALEGMQEKIFKESGVFVLPDALEMAVRLRGKFYPAESPYRKTIDMLQSAVARMKTDAELGSFDDLKAKGQIKVLERRLSMLDRQLKLNRVPPSQMQSHATLTEMVKEEKVALEAKVKAAVARREAHDLARKLVALEEKIAIAKEAGKTDIVDKLTNEDLRELILKGANARYYDPDKIEGNFTAQDVLRFVQQESGMDLESLGKPVGEYLLDLSTKLKQRIIGQDRFVDAYINGEATSRLPVEESKGPASVIVGAGPPGVGKSEFTKALAAIKFGNSASRILIEMSTMGPHSEMRWTGSGPGLVGSEKGGVLEPIRHKPYVVLHLDEFDKAHTQTVSKLLLQLLEDGETTDANGRKISVRQLDLIITGNWAQEWALNKHTWNAKQLADYLKMSEKMAQYYLDNRNSPEIDSRVIDRRMEMAGMDQALRSRLPLKILFDPLSRENAIKVAQKRLDETTEFMRKNYKVKMTFGKDIAEAVVGLGYQPENGVRSLRASQAANVNSILIQFGIQRNGFRVGDSIVLESERDNHGDIRKLVLVVNGQHVEDFPIKEATVEEFEDLTEPEQIAEAIPPVATAAEGQVDQEAAPNLEAVPQISEPTPADILERAAESPEAATGHLEGRAGHPSTPGDESPERLRIQSEEGRGKE